MIITKIGYSCQTLVKIVTFFSMDCLYLGLCTRLRLWKIHVQGLFPGSVSVFHTPPFSSLSELHHPILDQENQCRLLLLR